MKSYYIHLIRHGLTAENIEGRYIGHTDALLSEDGIRQIEEMTSQYEYPKAEVVFSSPLKRCTDTAKIIYPDKEPLIINELIEYNFGEFEGKTAEELKDYPVFPDWLAGKDVEAPFGESNSQFGKRITVCMTKIIEGLMKTGITKAAIVTHGGVISALLEAFGLPQAPMHEWLTPSGCGYTIRITPSIWMRGQKFEVVAEIPYLPQTDKDEDDYSDEE